MHYHAILKDVRVWETKYKGDYVTVAGGDIFGDSKQRWPDGTPVRTSIVQEIIEEDGKTYIETMNTTYLVEGDIKKLGE